MAENKRLCKVFQKQKKKRLVWIRVKDTVKIRKAKVKWKEKECKLVLACCLLKKTDKFREQLI